MTSHRSRNVRRRSVGARQREAEVTERGVVVDHAAWEASQRVAAAGPRPLDVSRLDPSGNEPVVARPIVGAPFEVDLHARLQVQPRLLYDRDRSLLQRSCGLGLGMIPAPQNGGRRFSKTTPKEPSSETSRVSGATAVTCRRGRRRLPKPSHASTPASNSTASSPTTQTSPPSPTSAASPTRSFYEHPLGTGREPALMAGVSRNRRPIGSGGAIPSDRYTAHHRSLTALPLFTGRSLMAASGVRPRTGPRRWCSRLPSDAGRSPSRCRLAAQY